MGLSQLGTAGGVPATELVGDLPLKNWTLGNWKEEAARISGQRIAETIFERHTHCFACPIGCGKTVKIDDGPYAGVYGHGPEYETLAGFGGNCLCDDLNAISRMNDLCNRYGLDTISTSSAIAFAMEAYEKGLISQRGHRRPGPDLGQRRGHDRGHPRHRPARGHRRAAGRRRARRRAAHRPGGGGVCHPRQGHGDALPRPPRLCQHGAQLCHRRARRLPPGGAVLLDWATASAGTGWYDPDEWEDHDSAGKGQVAVDFQNYHGRLQPAGAVQVHRQGPGRAPRRSPTWSTPPWAGTGPPTTCSRPASGCSTSSG